MFQFEEALMFHFPETDHTGLFVTIDAGTDVDIHQFVSVCESHLDVD